jgi:hypothetical protein
MLGEPAIRHALVVYESMFGNTVAVARAVAEGLSSRVETVDVVHVSTAPVVLHGVDLLVVGAPTHALGMSRAATRATAREKGAQAPASQGAREWLALLQRPDTVVQGACFDTRIRVPLLVGSAARAIRRRLRRLGVAVVAIRRFTVTGTPGPLAPGELDRARRWGAELVPTPTATHATRS